MEVFFLSNKRKLDMHISDNKMKKKKKEKNPVRTFTPKSAISDTRGFRDDNYCESYCGANYHDSYFNNAD